MKTLSLSHILPIILLISCPIPGLAQAVPAFLDFPAMHSDQRIVKSINIASDPKAKRFRTQLKSAIGKRANFAGHYVVVMWGCGTSCQAVAMVDVITGEAKLAPFAVGLAAEYHLESLLFVDSPPQSIREYYGGEVPSNAVFQTFYYRWDEKLKKFLAIPSSK